LVYGKLKSLEVVLMDDRERKTYLETKLRNLKRKYAKVVQHSDLIEETIELKAEIDAIERDLKHL